MLTGYDAKAVADIMGLAFLPSLKGYASHAVKAHAGAEDRPVSEAAGMSGIVFRIAGDNVQVVESRAGWTAATGALSAEPDTGDTAVDDQAASPPTQILIEKAVEQGLPRTALRHVATWLAGGDSTKIPALEWGVVPKTTLERRATRLSPEESERTERVARLAIHARRALGSAREARDFMMTPHPELDGRAPFDATRTDLGMRRAEQLLNALEYGLAL